MQEIYAVLMVFLGDIGFVLREGGNPSVSAYNLLMKVRHWPIWLSVRKVQIAVYDFVFPLSALALSSPNWSC